MNKIILRPLLITIILVAILCISCTKTTETIIEKPSWKLVEELDYEDKIILNSYVTTDSLYYYLSTHYGFWKYQRGDDNPSVCYDYGNSITQTLEYKPVICDSVSAYLSEDKTEIRLCLNSSLYDVIPEIVSIWDIDSTFSDNAKFPMSHYRRPVCAFNNNNQFLTIVEEYGSENLCLIGYSFNSSYSGIEIDSLKKIYSIKPNYPYVTIISFNDRFFVSLSSSPYIVYPTGEVEKIDDIPWSCLEFFSFGDNFYAFTSNNQIYVTYNSGENWELFSHISSWVSCFEIAGKLCCHRYDDIYEINFDSEEVRELDNWGLEGNEITSINVFNRKVYISTLSGLFYRELAEFFTYKEEDEKGNLKLEKY